MKKLLIALSFAVVVVVALIPLACTTNTAAPVLLAKVPTATPTGCAGTTRGNVDAPPPTTLTMPSQNVVAIPVSIAGATTANKLAIYFSDAGSFTNSDVLETALYSVNGAGTKATFVTGTNNTVFIGAAAAAGWVTFGIGNVSLSKNTNYLILAQFIDGNGGNTFSIGNNTAGTITASYTSNIPTDITVGSSVWNLPAVGANGYALNIITCP